MSTTDLIAQRAIALQKQQSELETIHSKVFETRLKAARRFEIDHFTTICNFDFKKGDLVLVRNTAIEKALNRKMRARYLGPLVVILRNKGGAYILCELDGSVLDRPIAQFRVIEYRARKSIPLPEIDSLDISTSRLRQLEQIDVPQDDTDPYIDEEDLG